MQLVHEVKFELPTKPKAWARARSGGRGKIHFEPKEQREHKDTVIALAAPFAPREPHDGPVDIALEFRLPIATGWPRWRQEAAAAGQIRPTKTPDTDNLAKMILDALKRSGRWFTDDSRIVSLYARKVYSKTPGTLVKVRFYREPTAADWRK